MTTNDNDGLAVEIHATSSIFMVLRLYARDRETLSTLASLAQDIWQRVHDQMTKEQRETIAMEDRIMGYDVLKEEFVVWSSVCFADNVSWATIEEISQLVDSVVRQRDESGRYAQ